MSVSAHSAGAYTATLFVMVNVVKRGGRSSPILTSLGKFFHHDGMYTRKRPVAILCVLCGRGYNLATPSLFIRNNVSIEVLKFIHTGIRYHLRKVLENFEQS